MANDPTKKIPFLGRVQAIKTQEKERGEPRFNFVDELKNVKVIIALVHAI